MKQQMTRSHLTESCTETTKFNIHGTKKQLVTWAPTQSHTRETERGHRVSPLMLRLVCFCAGRCCGDGLIPGDPRRSPPLGEYPDKLYVPPHATAKYRLEAGYSDLIGVSRRATVQVEHYNSQGGCLVGTQHGAQLRQHVFSTTLTGAEFINAAFKLHDNTLALPHHQVFHVVTRSTPLFVLCNNLIKKHSSVLDVNSTTDYLLLVVSTTHSVRHLCLSVTAPIETNVSQAVSRPDTVTMPVTCLKQDTPSSSGRAAPLLAEPRFGAGPQPYSE
uniref:Uncharacterized protein n=1 Tax=Timema tahoe TaxID=61484 RepID=A0A7R9FHR3_9NEOP|nr:unnamed protein product [Timema tahoe]